MNMDEFQPSGFGVDYDLPAFEKWQAAEQKRKDKESQARIELMRQNDRRKQEKKEDRNYVFRWIASIALILGILGGVVYGCTAWYQHEYRQSAQKWLAWMSVCDKAGGVPVGEADNLICTFPDGELPYGAGGYSESYEKKYGPVWMDNCKRAGGRVAGEEEYMICVFPSKAQLPYGEYGYGT